VRELTVKIVSEGVEATVPASVRETVEAVARRHTATPPKGVSLAELAAELGIDKSAASRRWTTARRHGYLRNEETRRGHPARLTLGDPLPDDLEVLPSADRLRECCSVANVSGGIGESPHAPPVLPEDAPEWEHAYWRARRLREVS
jgi:hypothetical protein